MSVHCVCIIARSKGAFAAVQRAGSDDQSLRTRRKSTNLPQRARSSLSLSLSLRPTAATAKLLFTSAAYQTGPTNNGDRGAAAVRASACVAYTLTGFFKSKLITISRAALLTCARRQDSREEWRDGERSKGLTEKSIFHQSIVLLLPSVVGRPARWTDERTNRAKSTIVCCIFCRQLFRSRRSQWTNERPFATWVEAVSQVV